MALLLRPAEQERLRIFRALEKTDPLRSTKLVGAAADEIALAEVFGRQLANPLGRIAEKWNLVFAANLERGLPRLQNARFVVRRHKRDEARFAVSQALT